MRAKCWYCVLWDALAMGEPTVRAERGVIYNKFLFNVTLENEHMHSYAINLSRNVPALCDRWVVGRGRTCLQCVSAAYPQCNTTRVIFYF